jgi:hypothetical protein
MAYAESVIWQETRNTVLHISEHYFVDITAACEQSQVTENSILNCLAWIKHSSSYLTLIAVQSLLRCRPTDVSSMTKISKRCHIWDTASNHLAMEGYIESRKKKNSSLIINTGLSMNSTSLTHHSWSWALFEKLPIVQLLKNLPAFYGTRRFITAFT